MTIDVLAYNSYNKNCVQPLRTCSSNLTTTINSLNSACSTALTTFQTNSVALIGNAGPYQYGVWAQIPTGSGWVGGFKVCDTSGYYRCGACSTWTVPGGITCARFQVWGAGGPSGSGCCCGGSPFGGTGAYASVIMPVTAGSVYCLCAGCAFCCYAIRGQSDADGCPSCVAGPGLTNFCAEGGEGNKFCQMTTRCIIGPTVSSWCTFPGGCLCNNGSDYCFGFNSNQYMQGNCCDTAANPDMRYPMISSLKLFYGSAVGGTVYGVRGSFGEFALDQNHYGYHKHPPIYGFENQSQCCLTFTSGSCGGHNCSANTALTGGSTASLLIPGAGGFAVHTMGNCTSICGDAGRMGMVCVSFK